MTQRQARIGLMLPSSGIEPRLADDLADGMQAWFAANADHAAVTIIAEDIGSGVALIEPKAFKLLGMDRVDLLVGQLHSGTTGMTHKVLDRLPRPFLALNLGENIPRSDEAHAWCVQHSLGLWQAQTALGGWAAHQVGRRAVIAMSLYDSGYDLHYAFRMGYEAAGGEAVANYLSHIPPDSGKFDVLWSLIEQYQPDLLYMAACGKPADDFLAAWSETPFAARLPLMLSPYALLHPARARFAPAMANAATFLPWQLDCAAPGYAAFRRDWQQRRPDREPSAFSLLGYEGAQAISAALATIDDPADGAALRDALLAAAWESPRGRLRILDSTQSSVPAVLRYSVDPENARPLAHETHEAVDADAPICRDIRHNPRSGWSNPYLCL